MKLEEEYECDGSKIYRHFKKGAMGIEMNGTLKRTFKLWENSKALKKMGLKNYFCVQILLVLDFVH